MLLSFKDLKNYVLSNNLLNINKYTNIDQNTVYPVFNFKLLENSDHVFYKFNEIVINSQIFNYSLVIELQSYINLKRDYTLKNLSHNSLIELYNFAIQVYNSLKEDFKLKNAYLSITGVNLNKFDIFPYIGAYYWYKCLINSQIKNLDQESLFTSALTIIKDLYKYANDSNIEFESEEHFYNKLANALLLILFDNIYPKSADEEGKEFNFEIYRCIYTIFLQIGKIINDIVNTYPPNEKILLFNFYHPYYLAKKYHKNLKYENYQAYHIENFPAYSVLNKEEFTQVFLPYIKFIEEKIDNIYNQFLLDISLNGFDSFLNNILKNPEYKKRVIGNFLYLTSFPEIRFDIQLEL